jgi:hypothetical protein
MRCPNPRAPATNRLEARMDAVYLALTIGFFALSLALIELCNRL